MTAKSTYQCFCAFIPLRKSATYPSFHVTRRNAASYSPDVGRQDVELAVSCGWLGGMHATPQDALPMSNSCSPSLSSSSYYEKPPVMLS